MDNYERHRQSVFGRVFARKHSKPGYERQKSSIAHNYYKMAMPKNETNRNERKIAWGYRDTKGTSVVLSEGLQSNAAIAMPSAFRSWDASLLAIISCCNEPTAPSAASPNAPTSLPTSSLPDAPKNRSSRCEPIDSVFDSGFPREFCLTREDVWTSPYQTGEQLLAPASTRWHADRRRGEINAP